MKIYVGNINETTQEQDLTNLFSPVGDLVSVKIIKDRYSGTSRGFGFVEFKQRQNGQDAITQLNGHMLHGASLRVNEARERETGGRSGASRW